MDTFSPLDRCHPVYSPAPIFGDVRKHRLTAAAVVKPGKAVLIGWVLHNASYGERVLRFYDHARLPAADDEMDWPLIIPPGETVIAEFVMQIPFFRGLSYAQSMSRECLVPADDIAGILLFA
jgi:hypothetical protein